MRLFLLLILVTLGGCVETIYDSASFTRNILDSQVWKSLALEGDVEAQYKAGTMYCCGERPRYDNVRALYWWCKAAKQEQRDAQFEVGKLYETANEYKGNVIPVDYALAYTYYTLAIRNGSLDAEEYLNDLKLRISKEDVSESKEILDEWPDIPCKVKR